MFKRILSFILAILMFSVPVMAEISFSDLSSDHWAYTSVDKLVKDGTVKGFEDGTFKPANTVTRAEFVKMMGVGPERRGTEFADVPSDHWAYEYIMTSGFETTDTQFYPSQPITRGETIELLWKRQGSLKGYIAPSAITGQYAKNTEAVAWAYANNIMMGSDGLNMRLSDSLSRAEAAALIIRTRETDYNAKKADFINVVSNDVLKAIFDSFELFDENVEYSENKTLTNGEMAKAALRIAEYANNIGYTKYSYKTKFEHKYAKDVAIIAENVLGVTPDAQFADKNATVEDTLAALIFAIDKKTIADLNITKTNNYYSDASKNIGTAKNKFLTYAYENGIYLYGDGTIGALKEVTHKTLAALLLQIDSVAGTQIAYSTSKNANGTYVKTDAKLNYDVASYPANKNNFACIIDGIDNIVYDKAITAKPAYGIYNFAREYSEMFISTVSKLITYIESSYGAKVEFVMYPNLVWDNGKGFTLRMKCNILDVNSDNIDVNSIFDGTLVAPVTGNLKPGMSFFVEIMTGYTIFM